MKKKILVVAHKAYAMPEDRLHQPIMVGDGKMQGVQRGWLRDDTGENISQKNGSFCELTALFWMWKNMEVDACGLCHYRRYLGSPGIRKGKWQDRVIREEEVERLLQKADVILPKKRHYWIETRESQYSHAHHHEDLQCVEEILRERWPDYLEAWNWMLETRSGHICNMFIMRREHMIAYCEWLFSLLFEAEKRLDISSYSEKDKRVFGYLGERLLDVWIQRNGLKAVEVPVVLTEKQHWIRKGATFLKRKIGAESKLMI